MQRSDASWLARSFHEVCESHCQVLIQLGRCFDKRLIFHVYGFGRVVLIDRVNVALDLELKLKD